MIFTVSFALYIYCASILSSYLTSCPDSLLLPDLFCLKQSYQKALRVDPSYKAASECLAIVLTDIGTNIKLAGNTQEGIQKYYEALKIDPHYAVILSFHSAFMIKSLSNLFSFLST